MRSDQKGLLNMETLFQYTLNISFGVFVALIDACQSLAAYVDIGVL